MTGQVIGHYRVLEKIGSGAMGEVFRARDERLGRDVALKLIRPASSDNPDHLRRFELEARAAAALNHPNIVAIYDVGFNDGTPYIVCELLEGKTLRKRLAEGALPVPLAVDYALQIVQGLIAAHDRRIVHRDLKPENLFVTTDGRVKILDFGVAKLQSSPEDSERSVEELTTVTRSGAVIGTVAYMSPEQLRSKPVDHRSDIFSVGAILYEMLAGRRAFRGETEVDTMTAVLLENPPEIDLEQVRVPESVLQIVRHCLEKEPENRFQSARDLAFALDTLSSSSGGRRTRLEGSRRQASVVPWALAAVLLAATLLLLANQWREKAVSPTYRRLTFEQGTVYSARFAPDFRAIVYGAAWNGKPLQIFSTVGDSLLSQPLNLADANLLAISRSRRTGCGTPWGSPGTPGDGAARSPAARLREALPERSLKMFRGQIGMRTVNWPWSTMFKAVIELNIPLVTFYIKVKDGSATFVSHRKATRSRLWITLHCGMTEAQLLLVDLSGTCDVLSPEWESEDGLAWSPDGKEVWFTAVEKGLNRDLHAVNMSRRARRILDLPEGMTLQDVAPDGRVLVSLDHERLAMATAARNGSAARSFLARLEHCQRHFERWAIGLV